MKFYCFHLMPYAALDPDYDKQYNSAWVTLPNSYYDPKIGHALYNRYLDELEFADACGFDGVCVNEHHQNCYGTMPIPNVMAAAGAPHHERRRSRSSATGCRCAKIRWASRKRSRCSTSSRAAGWSRVSCAASAPSITPGAPTRPNSRDRFHEAHDLILRAWTKPGPFLFRR